MSNLPRALTSGELALLRSDNQSSHLYLTIHQPTVLYTALLAAVPASTDAVLSITYNTGAGDQTKILADMTMYVGTVAGGYDLGMVRIRNTTGIGATSGTFNIDEQSSINWQPACFLTVVDEFTIWRRNIRLQGTTPYIDEIAYTNQNSHCDSIPCFGPHRVVWYTGQVVNLTFDASDSWALNNTITAYSWAAPGSTSSSGMATATPTIGYTNRGTYRVAFTVTNSDGVSFTGYRYVFVVSEYNGATVDFNLDDLAFSMGDGGWKTVVTLYDQASLSLVRDRALCIIHAKDWYGHTPQSLGFAGDAENIVMVGWIDEETPLYPRAGLGGQVKFELSTPQYWLDRITAFPAGMKDRKDTPPTKWTRFQALTAKATVWHMYHWRSTTTRCTDVLPLDHQYRAARIESPGAQTLWEQLKNIEWAYVRALPCCNRLGQVFNQVEQQLLTTAQRASIPTVMAITGADWSGNGIEARRVVVNPVSLTDLSGVAWDGTTVTALAALSPGKVFRNYGKPEVVDRLVLNDIATTKTLCGLHDGWKNNAFPKIPVELAQNNRFVDIAPYAYYQLALDGSTNPRGVSFNGRAIVRSGHYAFDHRGMFFTVAAELEAETFASLAIENIQPVIVIPPTPPPPPPPPPPIAPPPITNSNLREVWFATADAVYWAGDFKFDGSQPTWNKIPVSLDAYSIMWFGITPDGTKAYVGTGQGGFFRNIYETATPKTPSWNNILTLGTNAGGAVVSQSFNYQFGRVTRQDSGLYTFCKTPSAWAYLHYNGTSWSSNATAAFNMFEPSITGKDTFGVNDFVYTNTSAVLEQVPGGGAAGLGYESYRAPSGQRYYYRINGANGWLRSVGTDLISFPAVSQASMYRTSNITGAETGNQVYVVTTFDSATNFLWLSDDGSAFSHVATWAPGWVRDAQSGGGGQLVWLLSSVLANSVPIRAYNRDGSVVADMTGNFWSLAAGNQVMGGLGIVYQ